MVVNSSSYPCLYDDGSVEYLNTPDPKISQFKSFSDGDYWYIEVRCSHKKVLNMDDVVYDLAKHIPIDILEKIKTDNTTHLVILSLEPFINIINDIYRLISTHMIPEHKLIFVSELIDANHEVEKVAKKHNLNKIKSYWISIDERWMYHQARKHIKLFSNYKSLEKKKYDKAFINFNRRWRIHRPLFVSLLYCNKLLDRGYVSLGNTGESSYGWDKSFPLLLNIVDDNIKELLIQNKHDILNLPELHIDTDDLSVNLVKLDDSPLTITMYENSYFSLVSETCFFETIGRFLTEKTFKPMVYKHPFILIGPARSLEFLKKLGYKTFHPFINESYDLIEDNIERMKFVLNEATRLANLSEEEIYTFIDNVRPIINHNYRTLLTKRPDDFLVDLG